MKRIIGAAASAGSFNWACDNNLIIKSGTERLHQFPETIAEIDWLVALVTPISRRLAAHFPTEPGDERWPNSIIYGRIADQVID